MMRVPTRFNLLGYPGLAVLGYLFASIAAFYLVVSTFLNDRQDKEQAKFKSK